MLTSPPFSSILASVVRRHREKANLSQSGLAELAGVGKTVIFDIEHSKATIQLNTVLKVLQALNIKIELISPLTRSEDA
jgi:HTH-type transcriptional regulator / antitoxin HipB